MLVIFGVACVIIGGVGAIFFAWWVAFLAIIGGVLIWASLVNIDNKLMEALGDHVLPIARRRVQELAIDVGVNLFVESLSKTGKAILPAIAKKGRFAFLSDIEIELVPLPLQNKKGQGLRNELQHLVEKGLITERNELKPSKRWASAWSLTDLGWVVIDRVEGK